MRVFSGWSNPAAVQLCRLRPSWPWNRLWEQSLTWANLEKTRDLLDIPGGSLRSTLLACARVTGVGCFAAESCGSCPGHRHIGEIRGTVTDPPEGSGSEGHCGGEDTEKDTPYGCNGMRWRVFR